MLQLKCKVNLGMLGIDNKILAFGLLSTRLLYFCHGHRSQTEASLFTGVWKHQKVPKPVIYLLILISLIQTFITSGKSKTYKKQLMLLPFVSLVKQKFWFNKIALTLQLCSRSQCDYAVTADLVTWRKSKMLFWPHSWLIITGTADRIYL